MPLSTPIAYSFDPKSDRLMTHTMIDQAMSITHEHLLSIVNTESRRFEAVQRVRLLDIGCGDGQLLIYLARNLPLLNKDLRFDVYGFDVENHGVQKRGFITDTIACLSDEIPEVNWHDRIMSISTNDKWPYPNNFFDIVVSNQVLEHVHDHKLIFSEIHRTLRRGGFSVDLFPLKHYIYETHLNLPLVHRITSWDVLFSFIKGASRLGLGKFKKFHNGVALEEYAIKHADYIFYFTNYLSYREAVYLGKKHKMRISFKYTRELYYRKICAMLGMNKRYIYSRDRIAVMDWLSVMLLKYVSSVTLFLEKEEVYTAQ
jgi:SAM-dependent methyltransferase